MELLHLGVAAKVRDWLASLPFAAAHEVRITLAEIKLAVAAALANAALFITEGVGRPFEQAYWWQTWRS